MNKNFNVVIERDSAGYYVGSVPTMSGCHAQAKSMDVLLQRLKQAIELCLDVERDEGPTDSEGD